jgi:hypothetical protein
VERSFQVKNILSLVTVREPLVGGKSTDCEKTHRELRRPGLNGLFATAMLPVLEQIAAFTLRLAPQGDYAAESD